MVETEKSLTYACLQDISSENPLNFLYNIHIKLRGFSAILTELFLLSDMSRKNSLYTFLKHVFSFSKMLYLRTFLYNKKAPESVPSAAFCPN